jgi:hypothetical protein
MDSEVLWHRASLGVVGFSLLARPSRFGSGAEEQRGLSGRISTLPCEAGGSRQGEHDTDYWSLLVKQLGRSGVDEPQVGKPCFAGIVQRLYDKNRQSI